MGKCWIINFIYNLIYRYYNFMKTQEEKYYDWLFASEEERKKINPFTEMLNQSAKSWPQVPNPKF